MRLSIKRPVMVAIIIALLVVSTVGMPLAYSAELTAEEKALTFLSSVVGIDLAKYTLTSPTPPPDYNASRYPPQFCGLVKEECPSFTFEADGSKISLMSIFHNGQIGFLKITSIVGGVFFSPSDTTPGGDYIYLEPPAADLLNQTRTTLQRYQVYAAQVYGTNNSYLESMQNILNSVSDLSPANFTVGNINFQVSESENKTLIQWIYTENGVTMEYKRLELAFRNSTFESIIDNWRLYSVSGPSVITAEEAYEIALDAAQNYEMRVGYANGTTGIATIPDLSNAFYQMHFGMSPYRNDTFQTRLPSKIPRDPLTLYPYWGFEFYFPGGEIAGCSGIQVGVWGDTEEISRCSAFGYYGSSGTTSDEDSPSEEQQQEQPALLDPLALAVAISLAAVLAISLSVVALQRKNQHEQQA